MVKDNTATKLDENNWFKKHADAVIILTVLAASSVWMNAQFNNGNNQMNKKFFVIEKDITIIKTVFMIQKQ